MLFADVAASCERVAGHRGRRDKVGELAALLGRAGPDEIEAVVGFATGTTLLGRIGVGWASLADMDPASAGSASLTVADVVDAIERLAAIAGPGSSARRRHVLTELFAQATAPEQRLLGSVLGGELRQGALDGVMAAAVARAAGVPLGEVQRAAMFAGSLARAAAAALSGGAAGLAEFGLTPGSPVQPMLAATAANVQDALADGTPRLIEWKLDGARIQAHRRDGEVRLFTRNLNEVTARLRRIVDDVAALPGGDLVLDGEALGLTTEGTPRRFQDTIGDFAAEPTGEESGGAGERGDELRAFFFDVMYAGGSLIDEPLARRRAVLDSILPDEARLPSIVTADAAEAQRFLDGVIDAGHEGVMVKDLDSIYEAGRRGASWRKVKPVHTLDLVVIAAEWGHGRRSGWLSNLHLAARGSDTSWVMVGKTFKGLTDELLRWQTARLLELERGRGTGRESHVVHVAPELVVEIAVDGVQASVRYPGGVALQFARVRRYRPDKQSHEADTIETVQALLR